MFHEKFKILIFLILIFLFLQLKKSKNNLEPCPAGSSKLLLKYPVFSQAQSPQPPLQEPGPLLKWTPIRSIFTPESDPCNCRILFVIHSSPEEAESRTFLRNFIFKDETKQRLKIKHFFVIGSSEDESVQKTVSKESEKNGDVLLVDVREDYHNITHKARSWISFIHEKCRDSEITPDFVIKMDDDVSVAPESVLKILKNFTKIKNVILGRVFKDNPVVRNPDSKWYLSKEEYPYSFLGLYCQGMAYAFSFDLLEQMYSNLKKIQYLWMDDWYVTHGLLNSSRVIYFDLQKHYISVDSESELQLLLSSGGDFRRKLLFGHFRPKSRFPLKNRQRAWEALLQLYSCD